jgi:ketosteroid isomerase-like protein
MPEHPDIALVRRGYAAFAAGDVATLSQLIAADATQFQPGRSVLSGEFKGLEAILGFYGELASRTNGTFKLELGHIFTDGQGKVVATQRSTAKREAKSIDNWACLIFTVAGGQVRDIHGCAEDIEVWDDFWGLA